MLCQECKKNEAEVFLKLAVNNKVTEMHLCSRCAERKGAGLHGFEIGPMNISEMLGNMSGYFKEFLPAEKKTLRCQACGLKYHEFKEAGLLGCPHCYTSFEPQLKELLARIHGNYQHCGKKHSGTPAARPKHAAAHSKPEVSVAELKEQLKKAVEREDFEEAAALRDRIRELGGL